MILDEAGLPLVSLDDFYRRGSNPVGIAFELVTNPAPADFICPRGQRDFGLAEKAAASDYYLGLKRLNREPSR